MNWLVSRVWWLAAQMQLSSMVSSSWSAAEIMLKDLRDCKSSARRFIIIEKTLFICSSIPGFFFVLATYIINSRSGQQSGVLSHKLIVNQTAHRRLIRDDLWMSYVAANIMSIRRLLDIN